LTNSFSRSQVTTIMSSQAYYLSSKENRRSKMLQQVSEKSLAT